MQDIFLQRKLVQKVKVKDEDRVELEEVSDHANENFEFKQQINDNERNNLQSDIKEADPVENTVPVETISDEKEDIEMQRLLRIMLCFSRFGLLKLNADHEMMEMNFRKKKEVFVHKIAIYKTSLRFSTDIKV